METNASTTRDIEITGPTRRDHRTIPTGTRVLATPYLDKGMCITAEEFGMVYVEAAAVELDVRPVTSRIYFAVPGHYTIGEAFDTWADATTAATATIRPLGLAQWNDGQERFSRAFVDIRQADASGDRSLRRFEILRTGEVIDGDARVV